MKRPSFQFYPGDWLRSTDLRSCSLAAKGLWADMLCLMHEGAPYGYLKVNNKVILPSNLARMVGATLQEVEGLLEELETAGVFSRDEDGCIFSRRMVKDERVRNSRAAGGKKGGNPILMVNNKVNLKDNQEKTLGITPAFASSSSSSLKEKPICAANPKKAEIRKQAIEVLEFFNQRTQSAYKQSKTSLSPIEAILSEGYSVQDCRTVIVSQWRAWKDDEKMREFIRIKTIFAKKNFNEYYNICEKRRIEIEAEEKAHGQHD
jgi:uncharacterized phage protein (TIGR02220 family)